jgi:DNA ligase 4
MISDDEEDDERRLGLVFFDILFLDDQSLLFTPYSERRAQLERIVRCQPGRAMLSERFLVDMQATNPRATLRRLFAEQIADHQEGLMLKASESCYNDFCLPWVKLKKDYIPGFGDTLDLAIVGASWEKERGRELRGKLG